MAQNMKINLFTYSQLIFSKSAEHTLGVRIISLRNARKTGYRYVEERHLNHTAYAKINSRWIKDLNLKHQTIKLWRTDIGEILQNREWLVV